MSATYWKTEPQKPDEGEKGGSGSENQDISEIFWYVINNVRIFGISLLRSHPCSRAVVSWLDQIMGMLRQRFLDDLLLFRLLILRMSLGIRNCVS